MSFLAEYGRFVETVNSDPLWKTWVGISCLSAAVGRQVWLESSGRKTFGNMYVLLVGEPGSGKSEAMDQGKALLRNLKRVYFSADDTNAAVAVKELSEAQVTWTDERGQAQVYHAMFVYNSEFGTFLPEYDKKMTSILTTLFDNKPFTKKTMGRGEELIGDNYFGILGGCQPGWLQNTIPESAWSEGFMSRVILAYGEPSPPRLLSADAPPVSDYTKALTALKVCAQRKGHIRWAASGIRFLNHWIESGQKPEPTHPRLIHYNKRRLVNALKLTLLLTIDRGAEKIEEEDAATALALLFETEERMSDIFKAMRTGGDLQVMKELLHFMRALYVKKNHKPIPRQKLVAFLSERVPAAQVDRVIAIMQQAEAIKRVGNDFVPMKLSAEA